MNTSTLKADYVIVGMAFADTLVAETWARIVIVDRRLRPGGHWNDAYPFVRLHGPSATYGVNSLPLGSGHIDTEGLNAGFGLGLRPHANHQCTAATPGTAHGPPCARDVLGAQ